MSSRIQGYLRADVRHLVPLGILWLAGCESTPTGSNGGCFGGANSTGTLLVSNAGVVTPENVTFGSTGGYAAIVRPGGVLACTNVNHGGFMYCVHTNVGEGAQIACPS